MADSTDAGRRHFLGCAATAAIMLAVPGAWRRASAQPVNEYAPVRLVWADGRPLRASELEVGRNYVFEYPFALTPCLLLNLSGTLLHRQQLTTADGREYEWRGGSGPQGAIIAFSAICPHRLSYPDPRVSFISYRDADATFYDRDQQLQTRDHVIYCCSEGSVFDVTRGGAVIGGPAPEPIAAIALAYDAETAGLTATGVHGAAQFQRFFESFGFQLRLRNGGNGIHTQVAGTARVRPLSEYSAQIRHCRPGGGSDLL